MKLDKQDTERLLKIEKLVQGLYDTMNPFPNHATHRRGVQGCLDLTLASLETLESDIRCGAVVISFPHDRNQLPQGLQG